MLTKPTSYEEARNALKNKPAVSRGAFERLAPEIKPYAFCISGVEDAKMLQRVRDVVAEYAANPHAAYWRDAKKEIARELSSLPQFSEEKALRRAELLLRTHGYDALRVGQWELAQETKDTLPYFKYLCTQDERTRRSHRALHGLVLPVDHVFWDKHMPPGWDWNCRCQVVQISERQMNLQKQAEAKLPPERRRVLDEKQAKLLAEKGELWVSPTERIFVNSAKKVPSCKSLRMNSEEILKKFDPTTREIFLQKLESVPLDGYFGTPTARDWFEGKTPLIEKKDYATMTLSERLEEIEKIAIIYKKFSVKLADSPDIAEIGREIFKLPMAKQGTVAFDGNLEKVQYAKNAVRDGFNELETFVSETLLENEVKFDIAVSLGSRSYYTLNDTIYLSPKADKYDVCHEYMHFIEDRHSEIHKKCVNFLKKRANGEKDKPLAKLTGLKYGRTERAFEDEWAKKGGDAYSGKYYKDFCATEVLSMGAERFLLNPILFYKQDREYFDFVISVLQGL